MNGLIEITSSTGKFPTHDLPPLYEMSSAGNLKVWLIKVICKSEDASDIVTSYGVLGGKMQTTSDTIRIAKSEPTVFQQAVSEAQSKWLRKKKSGYVESLEGAANGDIDDIIEGGVMPMLAQVYAKHGDKITYPAYAQPKLDGMRCIAIKNGDSVSLWSRSRKRITSCPHIEKAIAIKFADVDITLDGELYNHALKADFEKIISAVRKDYPTPESALIQYHIYDVINEDETFIERIYRTVRLHHDTGYSNPLVPVETVPIEDEAAMYKIFDRCLAAGYEGVMVRNTLSLYESNRRSYSLQKVKEFDDAEFIIIGAQEGRGKLQGTLGTFTCVTATGAEFDVKMTGDQTDNGKYLADSSLWTGKLLTIKYQGLTNKNGVPRFPVGIRIREVE